VALSPRTLRRPSEPRLEGWGRLPRPGREIRSEDFEAVTGGAVLSRGLGRSYGDSSLPAAPSDRIASSVLADRILSFDPATGVLHAEAGLSLRAIDQLFVGRGFYAPVTPGTQRITLGGMVAADVHGKNHHRDGTFGAHVLRLRMRVADGRVLWCSPSEEPDLFRATVGGMGLTGHVLEVVCRLARIASPWIYAETERVPDIDSYIEAMKTAARDWPYTMGWIDCLSRGRSMGRGILYRGRWAGPHETRPGLPGPLTRPALPFVLPGFVLNPLSVRTFNALLYASHVPRVKRGLQHPEAFFFPLDAIGHWNRMYGPRGFTQYQCVLPDAAGHGAARRFLTLLTEKGGASMLCVIKDCGPEGLGLLSFPKRGVSIALDIPVRDGTQALVDALNEVVIAEGGRIYLAKDQFTRAEHFRAMEPRLPEWQRIRRQWDPEGRLRSAQSVRVLGDRA
jgi:FAD/FMN-containing dehydrogenase